jgi:hypothetical protein
LVRHVESDSRALGNRPRVNITGTRISGRVPLPAPAKQTQRAEARASAALASTLLAINFKRSWVSMLSLSDPHIPKDELWRNRRDHLAAKHEAIIGESDKHRAERARPIEADVTMTRGNLP